MYLPYYQAVKFGWVFVCFLATTGYGSLPQRNSGTSSHTGNLLQQRYCILFYFFTINMDNIDIGMQTFQI